MLRIEKLNQLVRELYEKKYSHRDPWADYLYSSHIFLVADIARSLSKRLNINDELSVAASILHDIADAKMSRFDPKHNEETEKIARLFLEKAWFTENERAIVVDDAIKNHSCRNGIIPTSIEWKIMAMADAIWHLTSDFYIFVLAEKKKQESMDDIRNWALPKIERDFYQKICFDDVREEYRKDYEKCKTLFG